jgi:DNA-binding phage protein
MTNATHWTARSPRDFLYSIASGFIEDLRERMEAIGMSKSKLAEDAKVHKSLVSRMFKNPGNLTLETMVKFARCVGMKVTIVSYEDMNDPDNGRGPIDPSVFRFCWERADRPADMWAVETIKKSTAITTNAVDLGTLIADFDFGVDIVGYAVGNYTIQFPRKPCVTSGSPNTEISKIPQSRNTSLNDRIAA